MNHGKGIYIYIHICIYVYILFGLSGNRIGAQEPTRYKSVTLNSLVGARLEHPIVYPEGTRVQVPNQKVPTENQKHFS